MRRVRYSEVRHKRSWEVVSFEEVGQPVCHQLLFGSSVMQGGRSNWLLSFSPLSPTPFSTPWDKCPSLPVLGMAIGVLADIIWAEPSVELVEGGLVSCSSSIMRGACPHSAFSLGLRMRDTGSKLDSDLQPRAMPSWLHLNSAELNITATQIHEREMSIRCFRHSGCQSCQAAALQNSWLTHMGHVDWKFTM